MTSHFLCVSAYVPISSNQTKTYQGTNWTSNDSVCTSFIEAALLSFSHAKAFSLQPSFVIMSHTPTSITFTCSWISRRVQWHVPVIQVTGRLRLVDQVSWGALGCSTLCRTGVHAKFGIDMVFLGEPGTTRLSKEGWTGPGRKRSRSNPPCCPVVG